MAADRTASGKTGQYAAKITLKDTNGKALKAGTDYDSQNIRYYLQKEDGTEVLLTDKDNPPAGSRIRVEIAAKGNYSGNISAVYRIIEKDRDISKAKIQLKNQEYTGKPIQITDISQFQTDKSGKLVCSIKDGASTKTLTFGSSAAEGVDFIVVPGSYENNTNKGTAKVTFQGVGQYGGYKTVTFTIGAKSIGTIWEGIWKMIFVSE